MASEIEQNMDHDPRIKTLRARCLARKGPGAQVLAIPLRTVSSARSLRATEQISSWQVRRGYLTRDRLADLHFEVDECELLVGRVRRDAMSSQEELQAATRYCAAYPMPPGQSGHCELDVSKVFARGIDRLRDGLRLRQEQAECEQAEALQSFILALDGLSRLCQNAAQAAQDALESATGNRVAELQIMVDSCRRIARAPPASFRDALQLLWLIDIGVQHADDASLIVPGRLDRSLWRFYKCDVDAGRLTRDGALALLECFYLLINEYIPDGLAVSVMVGGRDADGRDITNDLSFLCLEALRRTRLVYPTVGVCWHEGTPDALTNLAVGLIAEGCSNPAFFGDKTIQRGLLALGVPREEACSYINSTCVEITPVGSSNVWVASPYFNLCGLLLEEIAAQAQSHEPAQDFDAFVLSYRRRLADRISAAVAEQNTFREARQQHGRKPLQSVFTRDCIERARDIDDGGARYNWVECSFVGLANLADSLYVIREEVFRQNRVSMRHLKEMLDADFAGFELQRQRFLNGHPKYGNQNADVDALVADTVGFAVQECRRHRMKPDSSPFVPGAFVWVVHEDFGRRTGATPDGRHAGFPFADGCGPAQGREHAGPTAAILSTTSWDHSPIGVST